MNNTQNTRYILNFYLIKYVIAIFILVGLANDPNNFEKESIKNFEKKFEKLHITENGKERLQNLHHNSYYTAIKVVIGQLGKQLYKKIPLSKLKVLKFFKFINKKFKFE